MKACKVITTSFVGRKVRLKTIIQGNPPLKCGHSQNFPTKESVLDLVKLIFEEEKRVNCGIDMDTIIVNNNTGWLKGNNYLDTINNSETFNGKILIIHRENYGRSFGGYNKAFEVFKNDYDYWVFTEDDILINGDMYYKKSLDQFLSEPDIGFLAFQGISYNGLDGDIGENVLHAHGGVGLSSKEVLQELYEHHGSLPYAKEEISQEYASIIKNGEIAFTNKIHSLGYKLKPLDKHYPLHWYAWDMISGISNKSYILSKKRVLLFRVLNKLQRILYKLNPLKG